jgi:hypothetical protein
MCPNFEALNNLIIKDILDIDDLLEELKGAQFFSKLDLCLGYHQIHMKEANIPKIAFCTHEGHYEFLMMPFGILISSKTWQAHVTHMDQVFQLLVDHQLFLKWSKCAFGVSEVEFLGHIVSHDHVCVDPKNIEVM